MRRMTVIAAIILKSSLAGVVAAEDWKPIVLKARSYRETGSTLLIELSSGKTIEVSKGDWSREWSEAASAAQQNQDKENAARSTAEPPDDAVAGPLIRSRCAREWNGDFSMRRYCEDQQHDALKTLRARPLTGPLGKIRSMCALEWPEDFNMRDYCEREQLKALRELSSP